ncbi:MAG TPA: sugar phosphate isomerase/epimerase [Tepidisphaeraceae bacterium]|jgi:sugar phosphate isomerase/epimerase
MPSVLAAQLYTLRDFTRTPNDIATTMKKVKRMGYDAVQCSALGPIEPKELAKILRDEGLTCCATHVPYEKMRDQPEVVIEEHHIIGCAYAAIGVCPGSYRNGPGYHAFAREASEVARKLRAGGVTFGYHNHSFELEKFGGKTGLEILYAESDPQAFTAEIDTYWIQHGGGDPATWIRTLKGRVPLVHLKDMVVGEDRWSAERVVKATGESDESFAKRREEALSAKPIMAEVGEGNLNWREILAACREAGVVWYIVEQDICQRDPFESLSISLGNLKAMGME